MSPRKPAKKATKKAPTKPATRAAAPAKKSATFSADERAAMRERARELKAAAAGADGEAEVLAKLAAMPEPDRGMGRRLHALVKECAPSLTARTWYGMPAYAKEGKVLCFFQGAKKFKTRYSTLGFSDTAQLDDGEMWPTGFALTKLTPAVETRIAGLLRRAVG